MFLIGWWLTRGAGAVTLIRDVTRLYNVTQEVYHVTSLSSLMEDRGVPAGDTDPRGVPVACTRGEFPSYRPGRFLLGMRAPSRDNTAADTGFSSPRLPVTPRPETLPHPPQHLILLVFVPARQATVPPELNPLLRPLIVVALAALGAWASVNFVEHYGDGVVLRGLSPLRRPVVTVAHGKMWRRGGSMPRTAVLLVRCPEWRRRRRGLMTNLGGRTPAPMRWWDRPQGGRAEPGPPPLIRCCRSLWQRRQGRSEPTTSTHSAHGHTCSGYRHTLSVV